MTGPILFTIAKAIDKRPATEVRIAGRQFVTGG